jgi:hypothetical protein
MEIGGAVPGTKFANVQSAVEFDGTLRESLQLREEMRRNRALGVIVNAVEPADVQDIRVIRVAVGVGTEIGKVSHFGF